MPSNIMTKKLFADALKKLMVTKSFAKIGVGDIAKACGMNRNSFYYHFKDKYELLNWIFFTEITSTSTGRRPWSSPAGTSWNTCSVFLPGKKIFMPTQ